MTAQVVQWIPVVILVLVNAGVIIWHLSRWRDKISAATAGEPQVWVSQGWADKFGIDGERTGLGDTTEQVANFKVDTETLTGYAEAAHNAIVARVSGFTTEQFNQTIEYTPGSPRPAWRALISVVEDSAEHT